MFPQASAQTRSVYGTTCWRRESCTYLQQIRLDQVLQLCSYPVIGWPDASPGLFGCGLFKWRQFEPKVILLVVGWYLRFSLVLRVADKLSEKQQKKVDRRTL
jgi:hypothetical protein